MKKLLLLIAIIFSASKISAQTFQWASKHKATQYESVKGIAIDTLGNSYVVGNFKGSLTFGSSVFNSGASYDGFVVKYNTAGSVVWARQVFSIGDNDNSGVCIDEHTNSVYVTGSMDGDATFGSTVVSGNPGTYVYVAKYDSQGNTKWVVSSQPNASCDNFGKAIATDASGNVYATGSFGCMMAIGTSTLTTSGTDYDMFLAKYDSSGVFQWVIQGGSANDDEGNGVCVNNTGNIFVAGKFGGSATFGTMTVNSYGTEDIFLSKYNAAGAIQFVEHAGTVDADAAKAICADGSGNIYITGNVNNTSALTSTFGSITLNGIGYNDIFLAKYNSSGVAQWAVSAGNANSGEAGHSVTTDAMGNVYISGDFGFSSTFGSTVLNKQGAGIFDGFVAQCNSSGIFQWAKQIGTNGSDGPTQGISLDGAGDIYAIGLLDNASGSFGSIALPDTLGGIYVTKITQGTSGIENKKNFYGTVNVFPNPTNTGILNVIVDEFKGNSLSVSVIDITGQLVYSKNTNVLRSDTFVVLDLSSQAKGLYFLKVSDGENQMIRKFVIE